MTQAELSRLPIIALAPTPWRGRRVNRQHILTRLAQRGWPITYSSGLLSFANRGSATWRATPRVDTTERVENVLVHDAGRLLPRYPRVTLWDRFAISRHARQLKLISRVTGDDFICYVFHPDFWPYIECLRPRYVVFHAFDAYPVMPDWTEQSGRWQDCLVERADLRIVTFQGITKFFPERLRHTVRELPNGVDESQFLAAHNECPDDLARIPHPRIGYIGTINPKVDFDLLNTLALRKPEWHWVVVGRSDLETESDAGEFVASLRSWKSFRALPNVHYLGVKPFKQVAAYASHMDVNTICYRTASDGWWAYGSPNKMHECLAVGKPVVATPIETVRLFANVIDLAETVEEWTAAIERAVMCGGVGTPEQRRAVAMQNTWQQRVDLLEQWLNEIIQPSA